MVVRLHLFLRTGLALSSQNTEPCSCNRETELIMQSRVTNICHNRSSQSFQYTGNNVYSLELWSIYKIMSWFNSYKLVNYMAC